MSSSYEGKQNNIRTLKMPDIEVWENQYADRDYVVDLEIPEFTCICPKTALPDFAVIKVSYKPAKWCLELKSLKMYWLAYRNLGIFQENAVNRFLADVVRCAKPVSATVIGEFTPRGGVYSKITASYERKAKRDR